MNTKSWRTTTCAAICWAFDALIIRAHVHNHFGPWQFNFGDLQDMALPFCLFAVGWIGWHAKDHNSK